MDSKWLCLRLVIGQDGQEKPLLTKTHYFQGPLKDKLVFPLNLDDVCFGDYEVSLILDDDEILIDQDIWDDHFTYEDKPSITHNYEEDHPFSKDHLIIIELKVTLDYEWPCGAPTSDDDHPYVDETCPYSGKDGKECAFPHLKTLTIEEVAGRGGRKVKRRDDFPETNFVEMDLPEEAQGKITKPKKFTTLFHDKVMDRVHWVTYQPIKDSDKYEVYCHLKDVHIKNEKTGERTSKEDLKWLEDLSRKITEEDRWIDTDVW